jgi:hypothetical protein
MVFRFIISESLTEADDKAMIPAFKIKDKGAAGFKREIAQAAFHADF